MEELFKDELDEDDDDEIYDDRIIFKSREKCIADIINYFDKATNEEDWDISCIPYGKWDLEKIKEIMNKPETKIIESDSASAMTD